MAESDNAATEATLLARRFNADLEYELRELESRYSMRIRSIDVLGILEQLVANRGEMGSAT